MREAFIAMDKPDPNGLAHWKGQGVTDTAGISWEFEIDLNRLYEMDAGRDPHELHYEIFAQ